MLTTQEASSGPQHALHRPQHELVITFPRSLCACVGLVSARLPEVSLSNARWGLQSPQAPTDRDLSVQTLLDGRAR